MARTPDLNWPKRYSIPQNVMSSVWTGESWLVEANCCMEMGWTSVSRWWAIVHASFVCLGFYSFQSPFHYYNCHYYYNYFCILLCLFKKFIISTHKFYFLFLILLPTMSEEWANSCMVPSCHLGLNHNNPFQYLEFDIEVLMKVFKELVSLIALIILVISGFKNPLLWECCCTCCWTFQGKNLVLFSNVSEDYKLNFPNKTHSYFSFTKSKFLRCT